MFLNEICNMIMNDIYTNVFRKYVLQLRRNKERNQVSFYAFVPILLT